MRVGHHGARSMVLTGVCSIVLYSGMQLPIRIASWRRAKRLTQRQVAERVGVVVSAVSMWETGAASPTVSRLEDLAERAFGLTMEQFYGRVPKAPKAA